MMELYIETLTGAAFELRVSPFETIQSVKAKIQRLEGIPISQQHLIWQTTELDDDYCLHDYDIHNGATLKLVLAMRGGPINTRRVPIEDQSLVEYMESTPDELLEKLPGSSRQVTLLVFREGDQLNFFRVVDRGDGTLTPLSESLSAASMYNNMYDDEEENEGTKEKIEENARIKEKINSLRSKMDNLSVAKKTRNPSLMAPLSAGPLTVSANPARLQALHSAHTPLQTKPTSGLNRNRCLPPVQASQKQMSPTEHDYAKPSSAQNVHSPMLTELTIPKPPSEARTASHDKSQRLHHHHHHHTSLLTAQQPTTSAAESSSDPPPSGGVKVSSARTLRHTNSDKSFAGLKKSDSIIKSIPEDQHMTSSHSQSASASTTRPIPTFSKRKEALSLDKLKDNLRPAALCEASAAGGGGGASGAPLYARRSSSRQHEMRAASRQHADLTLETIKDSFCSQRITLESLSSNEAKMMSGLLQQASLEKLGSSSISNFSPVRTRKGVSTYSNYHTMEEVATGSATDKLSGTRTETLESLGNSSAKLPPVKSKKKGNKSSKRCFHCTKKTGLATSYICRCGNNFCAAHRYAELHDCTFDYKTEGRQLLEQNNPVVSAPKLPKI